MHVIAHLHPLGGHGHDVERTLGIREALEHGRQPRTSDVAKEDEAIDSCRGFATEPCDLARALIHRRESARTRLTVIDHPHRSRRAEGGRHRYDRVVVICRSEGDLPRIEEGFGRFDICGPAFGDHRGPHRAPEGIAHESVVNGRARVQEHALTHARDDLEGRFDTAEHGRRLVEPRDHLGIRRIEGDRTKAEQPGECRHDLWFTA